MEYRRIGSGLSYSRSGELDKRVLCMRLLAKPSIIYSTIAVVFCTYFIWFLSSTTAEPMTPIELKPVNMDADFLTLSFNSTLPVNPTEDQNLDAWDKHRHYGIVIDAGSSGSRVYIYSWLDATRQGISGTIKLEKADAAGKHFELKEEPGISTLAGNPLAVREHLAPLLKFASDAVPALKHPSTPIFLFATAGMRLVPEGSRKEILTEACDYVKTMQNFHIASCGSHFRVIPGELEGIFGWLTVNYLKTQFKPKTIDPELPSSYGFIDMGGASAQIAFEPTFSMSKTHFDDLNPVTIRSLDGENHIHNVFVTTFLGYGANKARERYLETFFKDSTKETVYLDPCLPKGLSLIAKVNGASLNATGTGNFDQCFERVTPLLNKQMKCPDLPCLFNGVHAPIEDFRNHHFLGVSEVWYTTFNVYDLGGIYKYEKLRESSQKLCESSWNSIVGKFNGNEFPNVNSLNRLELHCFKSAYVLSVLHDGFGIPKSGESNDAGPLLESIDNVNGFSVSWTMGAMFLFASSTIPALKQESPVSSPASSNTTFIWIFLLMILIAAAIVVSKRHHKGHQILDMSVFHPASDDVSIQMSTPTRLYH